MIYILCFVLRRSVIVYCFDPMFDCFEIFAYLRGGEFFGSSLVNLLLILLENMCFCEETCLFSSRGVPEVSYFLGGDSCVL